MNIRFLGHAAFALEHDGKTILIDPFLTGNPKAAATADEVAADAIFLTHGHADHIGDTVDIAKRTGATVVAIVELAGEIGEEGVRRHRPQHRRHRRRRLRHRAPHAGLAHLDDPQGHGQHAGRDGHRVRRQADLPPGRHRAVQRPRAARPSAGASTSR